MFIVVNIQVTLFCMHNYAS